MATYSSIYVSVSDAEDASLIDRIAARLQGIRPKLRGRYQVVSQPSAPWIEVRWPSVELPVAVMRDLSRDFSTRVIGMVLQTNADALLLSVYDNGKPTRELAFNPSEGWSTEGTAQPWEPEVFFDPEELAEELESAADEEQRSRLEQAYRDRVIVRSSVVPWGSIFVVDRLAKRLRLPGIVEPLTYDGSERVISLRLLPTLDIAGAVAALVGCVAVMSLVWTQSTWPFLGFFATWLGFGLLLRRSSRVVTYGLSLIASAVLLAIAARISSPMR